MNKPRDTVFVSRRPAETSLQIFRAADAREAFLIALSAAVATTRTVEKWAGITNSFQRFDRSPSPEAFRRFRARVRAFFGPTRDRRFAMALWHRYRLERHHHRLHVVAEMVRQGYRPEIQFEGRNHLDEALEAGNGVILWLDNFRHHSLIGKRPFAENGYASWQLSSANHGFSPTRLGNLCLNPLQRSAEARYVSGRIDLGVATTLDATRQVKRHLEANGIVRITNNVSFGRQVAYVPIGASAWVPVATTPLNLARRTGAALLPVAVLAHEAFRRYSVTVGARLPVSNGQKEGAFREAALLYASYLEPLIREHPEQWMPWTGTRSRLRLRVPRHP